MLTNEMLNQIKNADIDVNVFDSNSKVLHTLQEEIQRRESLLKNGFPRQKFQCRIQNF